MSALLTRRKEYSKWRKDTYLQILPFSSPPLDSTMITEIVELLHSYFLNIKLRPALLHTCVSPGGGLETPMRWSMRWSFCSKLCWPSNCFWNQQSMSDAQIFLQQECKIRAAVMLTFAVFLALVAPAPADPDSRMRDWDFPSLRARRGGAASPLSGASPVPCVSWAAPSPVPALGCAFAFSFSFSLSCSFTRSFSFSFSDLATSLRGRMKSAMDAFLGRPSWLASDFRPRFLFSVKKSPSFLLRVFVGGGQGATELAGATSCCVIVSSSCLVLHKEPYTSNFAAFIHTKSSDCCLILTVYQWEVLSL